MRDCNPSSASMIRTTSSPSLRALLGRDYCHLPDEDAIFSLHGLTCLFELLVDRLVLKHFVQLDTHV